MARQQASLVACALVYSKQFFFALLVITVRGKVLGYLVFLQTRGQEPESIVIITGLVLRPWVSGWVWVWVWVSSIWALADEDPVSPVQPSTCRA